MKRFIKRLIRKNARVDIIIYTIGGVLAIILAVCLFLSIDKTPATTSDYEFMEKQVIAIQQNPDLLFETDGNIYIYDDVIIVKFENDECKLTAEYNKNFEILSISKEDKSVGWLGIILFVVLYPIMLFCIVCMLGEICCKQYISIFKRDKSNEVNQPKR